MVEVAVEDGLANDKKRGKLTGAATSAERVAFEQMVRHTHTHNALQGELRPPQEALRDVILAGTAAPGAAAAQNARARRFSPRPRFWYNMRIKGRMACQG